MQNKAIADLAILSSHTESSFTVSCWEGCFINLAQNNGQNNLKSAFSALALGQSFSRLEQSEANNVIFHSNDKRDQR